ncbi:MAG TPA: response regulator [Longimicrobiaceae bacterium]|nr:response regulator [Longimicrobiaceae bacterium]
MPEQRAPRRKTRRPTVLVTDASLHLRDIYATLLRYHGYRALEASDGAETVEIARAVQPDAIILDMDGPGVNGLEAARILSDDPSTASTPVILLSLHSGVVYRRQARGARSRGYLEKPFEPRQLLREVERVLGRVSTPEAA